jgi:hypothetical protein
MLSHQPPNALLIHGLLLDKAQVGPDTPLAPEGMLSFQRANTLQQVFVALGDPGRGLPAQPSTSSLFFSSSVSSPTSVFSWAFSRARHASRWLCS